MYSYSTVETALAAYFQVSSPDVPSFRARIRNLQKLGLRPIAPGRGNRVLYTFDDVCDLALALSFTSIGVSPSVATVLVPSGTMRIEKYKEQPYCVYIPPTYTYSNNLICFRSASEFKQSLPRTERAVVINVKLMTIFVKDLLSKIEGQQHVRS